MRLAFLKVRDAIPLGGGVVSNMTDGDNVMVVDRGMRVVTVVHKGGEPVEVPLENVVCYRAMPVVAPVVGAVPTAKLEVQTWGKKRR